jgi:hypothetical protein
MLLVLGSCGDPVAGMVDQVLRSGAHYIHVEGDLRTDGTPAIKSLAPRLRQDPVARALLDAAGSAVPRLVRLLDDEERRTVAAVFLAEIGGDEAVAALLRCWRKTRDAADERTIYRAVGDGWVKLGYRYEGIDHAFYGELLMALAYAGRGASAEIAKDTDAAISDSERLLAKGAELLTREEREEEGRRLELRTRAPSIQTAREGLRLLAMLRAPEAPARFARALRSPVPALRRAALQEVVYLGAPTDELLRALDPLLDDPELQVDAAEQVEFLLAPGDSIGSKPAHRLPRDALLEFVARSKERLRGHLR